MLIQFHSVNPSFAIWYKIVKYHLNSKTLPSLVMPKNTLILSEVKGGRVEK